MEEVNGKWTLHEPAAVGAIQAAQATGHTNEWVPAFAGTTDKSAVGSRLREEHPSH